MNNHGHLIGLKGQDVMPTTPADCVYWRSLLFVPANNARYAEKALTSGADAIIIDLEDSVLDEGKAEARAAIPRLVDELSKTFDNILVRTNRPLSLCVRDIETVVCKHVTGIVVAKCAGAEHLAILSELIEEREAALGLPRKHTKLLPLIETSDAVARLDEIASSPRVVAIVCGDEDLAAELGCEPDSETLIAVKHRLVLAAARQGIMPLGLHGSIAEYRDLSRYAHFVDRSKAAGLKGTLCIHPNQVSIANNGFRPTKEQLDKAKRVVEAAEAARKTGVGSAGLDGRMIDAPVLLRAARMLKAEKKFAG